MEIVFLILLFVIAFLYSSVGHGGASGYLALMALFGIAPAVMKPASLTLNVFVAGIAFIAYARAGYFRYRLILPFLIASVPMAYVGASVHIQPRIYEMILGVFLLFAVLRLVFIPGAISGKASDPPVVFALLIGAMLGFFSGMIGIGGGIILSPILVLFHWSTLKESAAASALFILLNSISGLTALYAGNVQFESRLMLWIVRGLADGFAGSYFGSIRLQQSKLKYFLAFILLVASVKLIIY